MFKYRDYFSMYFIIAKVLRPAMLLPHGRPVLHNTESFMVKYP